MEFVNLNVLRDSLIMFLPFIGVTFLVYMHKQRKEAEKEAAKNGSDAPSKPKKAKAPTEPEAREEPNLGLVASAAAIVGPSAEVPDSADKRIEALAAEAGVSSLDASPVVVPSAPLVNLLSDFDYTEVPGAAHPLTAPEVTPSLQMLDNSNQLGTQVS